MWPCPWQNRGNREEEFFYSHAWRVELNAQAIEITPQKQANTSVAPGIRLEDEYCRDPEKPEAKRFG